MTGTYSVLAPNGNLCGHFLASFVKKEPPKSTTERFTHPPSPKESVETFSELLKGSPEKRFVCGQLCWVAIDDT